MNYPYHISLQVKIKGREPGFYGLIQATNDSWSHNCGGSVYNSKKIKIYVFCMNHELTTIYFQKITSLLLLIVLMGKI